MACSAFLAVCMAALTADVFTGISLFLGMSFRFSIPSARAMAAAFNKVFSMIGIFT